MRYLIHKSQYSELCARQEYLYSAFKMYFLPGNPEENYIPLFPVGCIESDILFITGHTPQVLAYLSKRIDSIPEKNIVITSCYGLAFKKFASKKTIYVPNTNNPFCVLRSGTPYGFAFNISDAELDFHNASGPISERIKKAYKLL